MVNIFKRIEGLCRENGYSFSFLDYRNTSSKINVKCEKHNYCWTPTVSNFINQKSNCKMCSNKKKSENNRLKFFKKIDDICNSKNYTFIGFQDDDFRMKNKLIIKCNIHNYRWFPSANNFIGKNTGCPLCAGNRIERDELIYVLQEISKRTERTVLNLSELKNSGSRLIVKCNTCSSVCKTNYTSFKKSVKCRKCLNILKLSNDDATIRIIDRCNILNHTFLGFSNNKNSIENTKSLINLRCSNNHDFSIRYDNYIYGKNSCSICNESKGEVIIADFLRRNNIKYTPQKRFNDCRFKKPLPFDFYLDDLKICIEFDGIHHFRDTKFKGKKTNLEYIKNNDAIKTNYCIVSGIKLLRIKYDENITEKLNIYLKLS
jgi:very-short-patch-repair endonuclease